MPANTKGFGLVLGQVNSSAMVTAWYWVGIPILNSKPTKQLVFRVSNANADSKHRIHTSIRYAREIVKDARSKATQCTIKDKPKNNI